MDYRLKCEPGEINFTAYGFYLFAYDYYGVAKKASEIDFGTRINYPAYFLHCRSIELAIKSALLASKRYTISQIKTHDFCKLLPKLDSFLKSKLLISSKDEELLLKIDSWYKTDRKRFEYFHMDNSGVLISLPDLPAIEDMEKLNNRILSPALVKFVTA